MDISGGKIDCENSDRKTEVNVDVEYCGYCNFKTQCLELAKIIKQIVPSANVNCRRGRQGSFEVKINDILVHSKIQSLAFPEYEDVAENVRNASEGKPLRQVSQQPINDCVIM